jgi:hypothetical protein
MNYKLQFITSSDLLIYQLQRLVTVKNLALQVSRTENAPKADSPSAFHICRKGWP